VEEKAELALFIEHAEMSGNYHVLDFYYKSWLPLKQRTLRKIVEEVDDEIE
jgi:hypothetical protein